MTADKIDEWAVFFSMYPPEEIRIELAAAKILSCLTGKPAGDFIQDYETTKEERRISRFYTLAAGWEAFATGNDSVKVKKIFGNGEEH